MLKPRKDKILLTVLQYIETRSTNRLIAVTDELVIQALEYYITINSEAKKYAEASYSKMAHQINYEIALLKSFLPASNAWHKNRIIASFVGSRAWAKIVYAKSDVQALKEALKWLRSINAPFNPNDVVDLVRQIRKHRLSWS